MARLTRTPVDRVSLVVTLLVCAAVALVVGSTLTTWFASEDRAWAYVVGGAIGFALGYGMGWLASRTEKRAGQ